MHRGYIKIWRRVEDSFIYKDNDYLKIWVHLLLKANHKDAEFLFNGKRIVVRRGQLITGRKKLSLATGVQELKCFRTLSCLESEQLIEQQKTNRFTLITILNYNLYQSNEQQFEQQMNNKRTTDEQQMNTNNNVEYTKKNKKEAIPFFLGPSAFQDIWTLYPSKTNKAESQKLFNASVKSQTDLDNIYIAINNYTNSKRVKAGYIQNADKWFNSWQNWINFEEFKTEKEQEDELRARFFKK